MPTARLRSLRPSYRMTDVQTVAPQAKRPDPFYLSPEYRRWAAAIHARSGGRCEDPDHQGPNPTDQKLIPDHIHEIKDGGEKFNINNGMDRCASCHGRKTAQARTFRVSQPVQ